MRIFHLGNFAEKGSPLGYCPNAEFISRTFEELGHEVGRFNESSYTHRQILAKLSKGNYNLLFTEEARLKGDFEHDEENDRDIMRGYFGEVMRRTNIPTVAWLTNLFWGIMRREAQIKNNPIFKADVVFTTDGGHQWEFEKAGVNHVLLRQGIYQKEAYIAKPEFETTAEIGFIGGLYENIWPYRVDLVKWLKKIYGDRFEHFGLRGEIRHHELNSLVSTLKIVVGDSVYSPHYWSNRIYEIIGRGGFLVTQNVPGLEEEFEPYKHFIPYKMGDFDQLKEILNYYLVHDEERDKIRRAGLEHCKKHHTYLHRVKKLLKTLEEQGVI